MNTKRFTRKFNIFGTMLLSTFLPCLLATLFLGLIFVPMMQQAAQRNDEAYDEALLYTAASRFDSLCATLEDAVNLVETSDWIQETFLNMLVDKQPDSAARMEILEDLTSMCIRSGFHSFSFRFYGDTTIYSNREVYWNTDAEQQPPLIQHTFWPMQGINTAFSTVTFLSNEYLLYQAPFRVVSTGQYRGEINILLHSKSLGEKLSQAVGPDVSAFRLTDAEGKILWEHTVGEAEGETVTLSRPAPSGQWYFCVDIPVQVHNQTRKDVMGTLIGALTVSLVISLTLSFLLSRLTYRPIQRFALKFLDNNAHPHNELVALERVFDRILAEKKTTEIALTQLRPMARQKILGALLDGTAFLGDSTEAQMSHCNVRFDHERFNVIAMHAPFSQLDDVEFAAELAMETLLEHLNSRFPLNAYLYYQDSDHYQVLVNYDTWTHLQAYLSQLTVQCKAYFRKKDLVEQVYLGVGQTVSDLEEVYRAAEQAETAVGVAALNRLDQPMFYSELSPELNYNYFYPLSEELLLSRAISNSNTESAKSLLHAIVEKNRSNSRLNPKCMQLLYMDLSSTVARSGQGLGITVVPEELKENYITLDRIEHRVAAMIDHICQQTMALRNKAVDDAERQLFDYVEAHLYDPNLSLNSIAEKFGKSPAYISVLFKEHRGTNYNNYVNNARIMRAIQLMTEEGLDSNAVYPRVGYTNLSTFRRNFSKYAKINPGQLDRTSTTQEDNE